MRQDLINSGKLVQAYCWPKEEQVCDITEDNMQKEDKAAKEDRLPKKDMALKGDKPPKEDRLPKEDKAANEGKIRQLDGYVNNLLAWHCMPTLLHIKPANLIRAGESPVIGADQLLGIFEEYASFFSCSCSCLYESEKGLMLLIYNRQMLQKLLDDDQIRDYLRSCGYNMGDFSPENVLDKCKHRLTDYYNYRYRNFNRSCNFFRDCNLYMDSSFNRAYNFYGGHFGIYHNHKNTAEAFPHEIGLLLGYPLKDVEAYIENSGKNYLLSGYWKVYHDKDKALSIFEAYTGARKLALDILKSGGSLRDIIQVEILFRKTSF